MDRLNLHLTRPEWQSTERTSLHMRGTAFFDNRRLPFAEVSTHLPNNTNDLEAWQEFLLSLNGFFALIYQSHSHVIAAVDRVRSVPLYFGQDGTEVYLSDDAEWIRQHVGDNEVDPVAREEFQLAGYVTGADTLFPKVKQLQPGEFLIATKTLNGLGLQARRYYRFLQTKTAHSDESAMRTALDRATEASIRRLVDYADDRQIVIPLSGGYDSRLIALMLKRIGYENVATFTYGMQGNREARYAKRVAEALDLPWQFVEYSRDKWRKAWITDERRKYQADASGWASLPHVQDWLAVRELNHLTSIAPDCVFVPGHGPMAILSHLGHFTAASRSSDVLDAVLKTKFNLAPTNTENQRLVRARVAALLQGCDEERLDAWALYSYFEWQERQSKFLANAVRVYEFHDYDWWLPLWDVAFVGFWESAPLSIRRNKKWYCDYVASRYSVFDPQATDLGNASKTPSGFWIAGLKRHAPKSYEHMRRKWYSILKGRPKSVLASDGRYDECEQRRLRARGFSSNGVAAYFFLRDVLGRSFA
ncbi:asparagine synthase-related protein [Thioalkalivibrio paradoxus]|uniref:asparagine synthase (glutamine-hydrolyzing) n=1 Tax=Thioalkalivibrio paradoxus ARh 1 TaxID=713585 RepID=W0DSZ1_9GAMM|nr:asparagine synthetase B family protein [Thioalkalivibrio paradoxus]AHE99990.1 hypothetical protein THITH_05785 [Thioalkalivibrio paradoxus ARh 1]